MRYAAVALLSAVIASPAWAHSLSPALLDLQESADGLVQITWKTSSVQLPGAPLRPVLPEHCRAVSAAVVTEGVESVTSRWTIDCRPQGIIGQSVGVAGLGDAKTDALVRVAFADGRLVQEVARGSAPLVVVHAPSRPATIVGGYLRLGMAHILSAGDHLLFVCGLLLLAGSLRRVIETVTAFTLGYSVTLSLSVLGGTSVPPQHIEMAVPVTVFVLAVELARQPRQTPSLLWRFPGVTSFAFGLLHGFGLGAALRKTGLPPGGIAGALCSFNVGIACGQLGLIAGALGLERALRRARTYLPGRAGLIPAYVMGSIAVLWCLQRGEVLFP